MSSLISSSESTLVFFGGGGIKLTLLSSSDMVITLQCDKGEVDYIEAVSFKSMIGLRGYLVISLLRVPWTFTLLHRAKAM